MISFEGKPNDDCIEYIIKQEQKVVFYVSLVMSIVGSIPIIILTFLWDWIAIIALPILIAFPFLAAVRPSRKLIEKIYPNRVAILKIHL